MKNYVGLEESVKDIVYYFKDILFPGYFGFSGNTAGFKESLEILNDGSFDTSATICAITNKLPEIKRILETDIAAAYEGDPAASSKDEVILAYPGLRAIAVYRVAHELYLLKIPILPRLMTEYAHHLTGIDIHPGATIGEYFFIDHGTGVVIGETTTIGHHVKLYQNVTLGAKSFDVGDDGALVKGIKRHPDIGNNVVIYAGATILGGDTVVGDGCTVGGNVWLTHSLEPGTTVQYECMEGKR